MKATRKIFSIKGNEEEVRTVLKSLTSFKAVTVLNEVTAGRVAEVFSNNKNVVCSASNISLLETNMEVVEVLLVKSEATFSADVINVNGDIVKQFTEIAEKHNIDIGDFVSKVAKKPAKKSDCLFCKLLNGNPVHEQASLYESENFLVVPGSGAFIEGYLMILPKSHVMSCAELDIYQRQEMFQVIDDIKYILKSTYHKEDILVWENGSGQGGKGKPKTSIVHAHIHVCPSTLNILQATKVTGIPINPISREELPKYKENSYLLIMDYDGSMYISYNKELYIPRQYVRQLIAVEHNFVEEEELWNWRVHPFWKEVEKTGNDVLGFVRDNFEVLSTRIQRATQKFVMK